MCKKATKAQRQWSTIEFSNGMGLNSDVGLAEVLI